MAASVFLSYARENGEFALRLGRDLQAAGIDLWIDQLAITGGELWDHAVQEALEGCATLVVILSPEAIASRSVMDEVAFALDEGKRVVPVVYRSCKTPFRLRRLQYVDLTSDYQTGLSHLGQLLAARLPRTATAPSSPLPTDGEPATPLGKAKQDREAAKREEERQLVEDAMRQLQREGARWKTAEQTRLVEDALAQLAARRREQEGAEAAPVQKGWGQVPERAPLEAHDHAREQQDSARATREEREREATEREPAERALREVRNQSPEAGEHHDPGRQPAAPGTGVGPPLPMRAVDWWVMSIILALLAIVAILLF